MDNKTRNIAIVGAVVVACAVGSYFAFFQKKEPEDHFQNAAESFKSGIKALGE